MDLKQSVVLQKTGIAQIPAWDRDANTAAAGVQASHNVASPSLKASLLPPLPLHTSSTESLHQLQLLLKVQSSSWRSWDGDLSARMPLTLRLVPSTANGSPAAQDLLAQEVAFLRNQLQVKGRGKREKRKKK